MAASGYVLEDLLASIISSFFVFVVAFHKIGYIGGILETKIARKIISNTYAHFLNVAAELSMIWHL